MCIYIYINCKSFCKFLVHTEIIEIHLFHLSQFIEMYLIELILFKLFSIRQSKI